MSHTVVEKSSEYCATYITGVPEPLDLEPATNTPEGATATP